MKVLLSLLLSVSPALCTRHCPENCARVDQSQDPPCDRESRHCSEGCKSGFHGVTCNLSCDINCNNKSCQQRDGACSCKTGYITEEGSCRVIQGIQCKGNHHCRNDMCTNGRREECLHGCKQGWTGKFCKQKCSKKCNCDDVKCSRCFPGWYGIGCESRCTLGCLGQNCDSNGTCEKGCEPGLFGDKCQRQCSPHCVSGCDQMSGECVQCEAGRYGSTCQSECSAGCAGCDRDGSCKVDCDEGYYGEKCEFICPPKCHDSLCDLNGCQKCTPGFFGAFCNDQCIHCIDGMCHQDTGGCIKGCRPGYYGNKCEIACPPYCQGGMCDYNGTCITCKTGFYGPWCRLRCEECLNGDCHKETGECNNEDGTDWMPYIIGGGVLLIVVVLAVCMVCCLKRMQGIVDNGMKSIGENSVVNFELGTSASVCSMNNTRVCESNHESVDPTYNHLFAFKPFSVDSSFDDLEKASGYCSVLLQDKEVINDGQDTKSTTSLADAMFDEEGACGGVQKEDGGAKKTREIIFLQSQEDEEGVLRDEGGNDKAGNVRNNEVINLSRLTNVDAALSSIGDWAGRKSGLNFKEDDKCKHYHTQDGGDRNIINPLVDNTGSMLTDEKETLRDQHEIKEMSMAYGDLHSRDAEDNNGKETREDAGETLLIERENTRIEFGGLNTGVINPYARSKLAGEVGAGGGVRSEDANYEGTATIITWGGLQSNSREAREDGVLGGTIKEEGSDWSIIVGEEDNKNTGVLNGESCHLSTEGVQLQSSGDDLFYDGSQQSPRDDNSDSSQRKTTKKECDRYPYVDIIVTKMHYT